METWRIGDIKVTSVVERGLRDVLHLVLPDATPEALHPIEWLQPHYVDTEGRLLGNVQALIIETASRRILVDTCIGADKDLDTILPVWSRLQSTFLEDLLAAGYPRESIDTVLCTHLHPDHIGWNTMKVDGHWVPTFPNARYLFGREEFEARDFPRPGRAGKDSPDDYVESILPVLEAGLVDFVETDHAVCAEVSLRPTPGHTAGHVSVVIRSGGVEAIITGDVMHHPCQLARPDWGCAIDVNGARAIETRRMICEELAGGQTLVIGTHFAAPAGGYIIRDEDAYRFKT